MSLLPAFYFSSKKEDPKTCVQFNLSTINNVPCMELNSSCNIDFEINNVKYILDLSLLIKTDMKSEPLVEIKHNINKCEDQTSGVYNVEELLSFMNDFKNKIENQVQEENKNLEQYEKTSNLLNEKMKELLNLEDDLKNKEQLRDKTIDDIKVESGKLEDLISKQKEIQNSITYLSKVQQELISSEEEVKNDQAHNELIQNIKTYNEEINLKNKILEEVDPLKISETDSSSIETQKLPETVVNVPFNQNNIISYLKNELETIYQDEKKIDNINPVEDKEKIDYLKDKYATQVNTDSTEEEKLALNIAEDIYDHLKLIITDNPDMIYTNLTYVITELMKFVETFNMEGFDKKEFIIMSIKRVLNEMNISSSSTDIIIDKICPELIDILLLVDQRKIIIRKKLSCFIPWCS